jgi:hypothetical protein
MGRASGKRGAPCSEWQAEQLYTAQGDVQTQRVNFFNSRSEGRAEKMVHFLGFSQRAVIAWLRKVTASA